MSLVKELARLVMLGVCWGAVTPWPVAATTEGLPLLEQSSGAGDTISPAEQTTTEQSNPIISYVNENHHNGTYRFSYETVNGISVQEEGYVRLIGRNRTKVQAARGTYSYIAPDGRNLTVVWYADETGYHAFGSHLPTPEPPLAQRPGFVPIISQVKPVPGQKPAAPEFWRG